MKRYWYHIRQNNPLAHHGGEWGSTIRIYPRSTGYFRGPDEPDTVRFCVAPTIAQCVSALGEGCLVGDAIRVYRTAIQHEPCHYLIPAVNVSDAYITDEHWFLKPVTMKLYRIIPKHRYHLTCPSAGASETFGDDWGVRLIKQAKYLHSIENNEDLQCKM